MPTPRAAGGAGAMAVVVAVAVVAVTADALTDWWGALLETWMPLAFVALALAVALWSMASTDDDIAPRPRITEAHSTSGGCGGAMASGSGGIASADASGSMARGAGASSRGPTTPPTPRQAEQAVQPPRGRSSRRGTASRWLRSWALPGTAAEPPTIEMSSLGGGGSG